jgi:ABC-type antimicrobial peptide transport system permease subunit
MALGNTKVILEKSAYIQEGETEISERAFNLIIGGMLLWGFLLNYLTVTLFAEQAIHLVMGMNPILFIAIYFALVIAGNVMVTQGGAGLSFIGMGIQPPAPEWGSLLSNAQTYLFAAPYMLIFPGIFIVITSLAFNLVGDGLTDALDPKLKD